MYFEGDSGDLDAIVKEIMSWLAQSNHAN